MNQLERIKKLEQQISIGNDDPVLIIWYGEENEVGIYHPNQPNSKFSFESREQLDEKIQELEKTNEVRLVHYVRRNDDTTT